jgi:hypothetical protein
MLSIGGVKNVRSVCFLCFLWKVSRRFHSLTLGTRPGPDYASRVNERNDEVATTETSIAGVEATGHNTDVGLELKVGLAGETRTIGKEYQQCEA